MADQKNINARLRQKYDTSENWKKAGDNDFIPLKGEIIVYSDLGKIKVGDGVKNINEISFLKDSDTQSNWNESNIIDPSFIQNKPAISSGIGANSIIEGEDTYAFGIAAHAEGKNVFTPINWRLSTTDPERKIWKYYALGTATVGDYIEHEGVYLKIVSIDTSEKTITLSNGAPGVSINDVVFHYYGMIGAYGDYSHTEGEETTAIGDGSHAEGYVTKAKGHDSHAEGYITLAIGFASHAEGGQTHAEGNAAHAEGSGTQAIGNDSHAEGFKTIASGEHAHAEGRQTDASGFHSHAEGDATKSIGESSHAEGYATDAIGFSSHAEGYATEASGDRSHAEGNYTVAIGFISHAEGSYTIAQGINSHAENDRAQAEGESSHAEGKQTKAKGKASHTEGIQTRAEGEASHAEGIMTLATGENSHTEGYYTNAQGAQSHAEGQGQRTEQLRVDTTDEPKKYLYYGDNEYFFGEVGNIISSEVSGVITTIASIDLENQFIYTTEDLFPEPYSTQVNTLVNVALFDGIASGEGAHSEGYCTTASARGAHSEGGQTEASGMRSHAEGGQTTASGLNAHAEGWNTLASGNDAHAEGNTAQAIASYSHAEGFGTEAKGTASHAEGWCSKAIGVRSHAEGSLTEAEGQNSHAEGEESKASGNDSHAEGYKTEANGVRSHAEGNGTIAEGVAAHAEGELTTAYGDHSHAEGLQTRASGESSHAEGEDTWADGFYSHAEGLGTRATSIASHAEGNNTMASGLESHAEGGSTIASGNDSHAEGYKTEASGMRSHAEGDSTIAKGSVSHAEGLETKAMGSYSHTEGAYTKAEGEASHAEGFETKATGVRSHAEGDRTVARGKDSHAEGVNNSDTSFDILYLSAQGGLKTTYNVEESPWSSYTVTNKEGESNYGFILNADNYYVSQNSHQEYSYALCQISLDMPQSSAICFDVCIDSETFLDGLYFSLLDQTFDASSYAPSSYFAYFTGQKKHEAVVYEVPAGTHTIDIKYIKDESLSMGEDQAKFKILTPQLSDAYVGKIIDSNNNQSKIIGVNISDKTITVDKTLAGVSLSYKFAKVISTGAYGEASHSEGYNTLTADSYSHAEGEKSIASGQASHAEGNSTHAVEKNSHAEGFETKALGEGSHVEGYRTYATGAYSHVEGRYNEIDQKGDYAHIVGIGTSPSDRRNGHTVDWKGNGTYAGMMTANGGLTLASGTGYGQDIPEDADEGRIFFMPDNTANCIVSHGQVTPEGEATTWYYEEYESGLVKVWGARTLTLQAGTWKDLANGVSEYNATLSAILPFSIATVLSETFNVTNHTDFTPFSTKSVARTSSSRTNQYRVAACNNIKPAGNISITINFFILGYRY